MEYRRVGRAGVKVGEIGLGACIHFGGAVDEEAVRACVKAALENGVNFLDNADSYVHGEGERVVGKVIRDLGLRRQDLVLSSKVCLPMSDSVNDRGLSRKHVMESIEGSLRRYGTDYLDLYFCHQYDPETPVDEVVRAMDDLVHQGKVLYWGTSNWRPEQIESVVEAARLLTGYPPQVEQPRYNMLDRHIEPEVLPTCTKHGIGITVFSPLAQGLLTGKYNEGIPEGSRADRTGWLEGQLTEENLTKVRRLTALARDLGLEMAQLALAWILRRPEISSVITGASKPEQVVSNAQASDVELSDDVVEQIEDSLRNKPEGV